MSPGCVGHLLLRAGAGGRPDVFAGGFGAGAAAPTRAALTALTRRARRLEGGVKAVFQF